MADLPRVFAVNQVKAVTWFAKLVVIISPVGFKVWQFVSGSVWIVGGPGKTQFAGVNRKNWVGWIMSLGSLLKGVQNRTRYQRKLL